MDIKGVYKSIFISALALISTSAFSGNQGISLYYGAGLGGAKVDYDFTDSSENIGLIQGLVGIEEDGWSLEFTGHKYIKSGESWGNSTSTAVGYRTVEQGGVYFKFKYGSLTTKDDDGSSDGSVFGMGIGFRTERDRRLEIEYAFTDQEVDDVGFSSNTKLHMLTLSYLFAGAPYSGDLFSFGSGGGSDRASSAKVSPFYIGLM
ncbi:MAG: hypothetical protein ACN4GM_13400, partial [Gammaproteobacteria bacterium]